MLLIKTLQYHLLRHSKKKSTEVVKLLKLYQTNHKLLICPTQIKVTNQILNKGKGRKLIIRYYLVRREYFLGGGGSIF